MAVVADKKEQAVKEQSKVKAMLSELKKRQG
jgi:hypothetical protein